MTLKARLNRLSVGAYANYPLRIKNTFFYFRWKGTEPGSYQVSEDGHSWTLLFVHCCVGGWAATVSKAIRDSRCFRAQPLYCGGWKPVTRDPATSRWPRVCADRPRSGVPNHQCHFPFQLPLRTAFVLEVNPVVWGETLRPLSSRPSTSISAASVASRPVRRGRPVLRARGHCT